MKRLGAQEIFGQLIALPTAHPDLEAVLIDDLNGYDNTEIVIFEDPDATRVMPLDMLEAIQQRGRVRWP